MMHSPLMFAPAEPPNRGELVSVTAGKQGDDEVPVCAMTKKILVITFFVACNMSKDIQA